MHKDGSKGGPGNFWKDVREEKRKGYGMERRKGSQRGPWKGVSYKDM